MNCIKHAFTYAFDIHSRARRKEYWLFALVQYILVFIAAFIDIVIGTGFIDEYGNRGPGLFYLLTLIILFLPGFTVSIRRLHDIGRSGWWLLLMLVPIVGPIILLVFFLLPSQPGENEYGPIVDCNILPSKSKDEDH